MKITFSKKTIILTSFIVLILILVVINLLTPKKVDKKNIITEETSSNPPTASSSTTLSENLFEPTGSTLEIKWGSVTPSFKDGDYSTYQTSPVLNDSNISSFASLLGFLDTNKESLGDNDFIWKKGDEILLYISSNNTVDYQNLKKYSGSTTFNETLLIDKATKFASTLFPQIPLTLSLVRYYKNDAYTPVVTNVENSLLAEISFNQKINDSILIPTNLSSEHFLTIFITPDLNIQSFKNSPGYQSMKVTNKKSVASYEKLISISSTNFKKLSVLSLDKESLVSFSKKTIFTVSKIDIAYTIIGTTAVPLYYVEGSLFADNIKVDDKIIYIAPIN